MLLNIVRIHFRRMDPNSKDAIIRFLTEYLDKILKNECDPHSDAHLSLFASVFTASAAASGGIHIQNYLESTISVAASPDHNSRNIRIALGLLKAFGQEVLSRPHIHRRIALEIIQQRLPIILELFESTAMGFVASDVDRQALQNLVFHKHHFEIIPSVSSLQSTYQCLQYLLSVGLTLPTLQLYAPHLILALYKPLVYGFDICETGDGVYVDNSFTAAIATLDAFLLDDCISALTGSLKYHRHISHTQPYSVVNLFPSLDQHRVPNDSVLHQVPSLDQILNMFRVPNGALLSATTEYQHPLPPAYYAAGQRAILSLLHVIGAASIRLKELLEQMAMSSQTTSMNISDDGYNDVLQSLVMIAKSLFTAELPLIFERLIPVQPNNVRGSSMRPVTSLPENHFNLSALEFLQSLEQVRSKDLLNILDLFVLAWKNKHLSVFEEGIDGICKFVTYFPPEGIFSVTKQQICMVILNSMENTCLMYPTSWSPEQLEARMLHSLMKSRRDLFQGITQTTVYVPCRGYHAVPSTTEEFGLEIEMGCVSSPENGADPNWDSLHHFQDILRNLENVDDRSEGSEEEFNEEQFLLFRQNEGITLLNYCFDNLGLEAFLSKLISLLPSPLGFEPSTFNVLTWFDTEAWRVVELVVYALCAVAPKIIKTLENASSIGVDGRILGENASQSPSIPSHLLQQCMNLPLAIITQLFPSLHASSAIAPGIYCSKGVPQYCSIGDIFLRAYPPLQRIILQFLKSYAFWIWNSPQSILNTPAKYQIFPLLLGLLSSPLDVTSPKHYSGRDTNTASQVVFALLALAKEATKTKSSRVSNSFICDSMVDSISSAPHISEDMSIIAKSVVNAIKIYSCQYGAYDEHKKSIATVLSRILSLLPISVVNDGHFSLPSMFAYLLHQPIETVQSEILQTKQKIQSSIEPPTPVGVCNITSPHGGTPTPRARSCDTTARLSYRGRRGSNANRLVSAAHLVKCNAICTEFEVVEAIIKFATPGKRSSQLLHGCTCCAEINDSGSTSTLTMPLSFQLLERVWPTLVESIQLFPTSASIANAALSVLSGAISASCQRCLPMVPPLLRFFMESSTIPSEPILMGTMSAIVTGLVLIDAPLLALLCDLAFNGGSILDSIPSISSSISQEHRQQCLHFFDRFLSPGLRLRAPSAGHSILQKHLHTLLHQRCDRLSGANSCSKLCDVGGPLSSLLPTSISTLEITCQVLDMIHEISTKSQFHLDRNLLRDTGTNLEQVCKLFSWSNEPFPDEHFTQLTKISSMISYTTALHAQSILEYQASLFLFQPLAILLSPEELLTSSLDYLSLYVMGESLNLPGKQQMFQMVQRLSQCMHTLASLDCFANELSQFLETYQLNCSSLPSSRLDMPLHRFPQILKFLLGWNLNTFFISRTNNLLFLCLRPLLADTVQENDITTLCKTLFDLLQAIECGHKYQYAISFLSTMPAADGIVQSAGKYSIGEQTFRTLFDALQCAIRSITCTGASENAYRESSSSCNLKTACQQTATSSEQLHRTSFAIESGSQDDHFDMRGLSKDDIAVITQCMVTICFMDLDGPFSMHFRTEKSIHTTREKLFDMYIRHIVEFAKGNSCRNALTTLTIDQLLTRIVI